MTTTLRLTGSVSGLDTESLIKAMMQSKRAPLTKLVQQKQTIEWKRDSYRETNTTLTAIRTLVDKMRFSSSYNKQSATSSDTSVVTATTSSSATSGGFSVRVDSLASSALLAGEKVAVDLTTKLTETGTFTINGKDIKVEPDATYASVMKQVNSANIGVTMSYDSINSRFMLSTSTTGKSASIQVSDTTNDIADRLFGITTSAPVTGTNASIQVNGTSLEFENNSFELNGVRFDLKGVSTSAVSVNVAQDTSNIVDQITSFVDQYNALVDSVNDKTKTVHTRSYTPLTDEEKEEMTESQITLWETKAKVGLLYGDDILTSAMSSLKSALMEKVKGLSSIVDGKKVGIDSLSDIGVTFKSSSSGTSEIGKLEIDTAKLKAAVTDNPDGIMNLFTKTSTLKSTDSNYQSETGYADRLYSSLTQSINKLIKRIGTGTVSDTVDSSQYGKQIDTINKSVTTLTARLQDIEDRYYKQFSAMEVALQKLNSKSTYLTSMTSS